MEQSSSSVFQYHVWAELMSKQKTMTLSYAILTEKQIMRNKYFLFFFFFLFVVTKMKHFTSSLPLIAAMLIANAPFKALSLWL